MAMNIVIHDPSLNSLLSFVKSRLPSGITSDASFRKYERINHTPCGSCHFCCASESLLEVASLICRILGSGYRNLNVFLVLEHEQYLYSTFMLDYLRSLYALVIHTYSRYKSECGLYMTSDPIGLMNPNLHNLNLLPVYDWKHLLTEGESISVFQNAGKTSFLYVEGSKYVFREFYSTLKSYNAGEGTTGKLASCLCVEEEHRHLKGNRRSKSRNVVEPNKTSGFGHSAQYKSDLSRHETVNTTDSSFSDASSYHSNAATASGNGYQEHETWKEQDVSNGVKQVTEPKSTASCYVGKMRLNEQENIIDEPIKKTDDMVTIECCFPIGSSFHEGYCAKGHMAHNVGHKSSEKNLNQDKGILEIDCQAVLQPSDEGGAVREVLLFDNVMCCGTFDCLHFGHKYLLLLAFLSCNQSIHIGITGADALLSRKSDHQFIESYEKRLEAVENYLRFLKLLYGRKTAACSPKMNSVIADSNNAIKYANCDFFNYRTDPIPLPECDEMTFQEFNINSNSMKETTKEAQAISVTTFKLMDVYGPAGVFEERFALVISPESLPGAEKVNQFRYSKGLMGWPVLSAGFVLHPDFGHPRKTLWKVSSSNIRRGMRSMSLQG